MGQQEENVTCSKEENEPTTANLFQNNTITKIGALILFVFLTVIVSAIIITRLEF